MAGFYGSDTALEELQQRVQTLNGYITRGTDQLANLYDVIAREETDIRQATKLKDEYEQILRTTQGKSAGTITATLKLDTTEFDRDLAAAKERSHN